MTKLQHAQYGALKVVQAIKEQEFYALLWCVIHLDEICLNRTIH